MLHFNWKNETKRWNNFRFRLSASPVWLPVALMKFLSWSLVILVFCTSNCLDIYIVRFAQLNYFTHLTHRVQAVNLTSAPDGRNKIEICANNWDASYQWYNFDCVIGSSLSLSFHLRSFRRLSYHKIEEEAKQRNTNTNSTVSMVEKQKIKSENQLHFICAQRNVNIFFAWRFHFVASHILFSFQHNGMSAHSAHIVQLPLAQIQRSRIVRGNVMCKSRCLASSTKRYVLLKTQLIISQTETCETNMRAMLLWLVAHCSLCGGCVATAAPSPPPPPPSHLVQNKLLN